MSEPHPVVYFTQNELAEDLPPPEYATDRSAGLDLRAALPLDETMILQPGAWALVPTGLSIALPEGFEAQVRPRSGLAFRHGIGILNAPGTIDEDYRGEIKVILFNFGKEPFAIKRGERIAQIVVQRVEHPSWELVETLTDTERGAGGFGHTGRH